MAEEKKDAPAEGEKKEAPKGAADAGAPADGAPKKKGLPLFAIGLGGGGATVIAMAYFLTVAAVQTGASVIPQPLPGSEAAKAQEHPTEEKGAEGGHAEEKPAEGHGEAKPEGEGHGGGEKKEGDAKAAPAGGPGHFEFAEISTNPKGSGQKRFVICQFAVDFEAQDSTVAAQKFETGTTKNQIRDRFISLMRSKTVEELEGSGANHELLKREVRETINRVAFPKGEGRVTEVYITKFTIQ